MYVLLPEIKCGSVCFAASSKSSAENILPFKPYPIYLCPHITLEFMILAVWWTWL